MVIWLYQLYKLLKKRGEKRGKGKLKVKLEVEGPRPIEDIDKERVAMLAEEYYKLLGVPVEYVERADSPYHYFLSELEDLEKESGLKKLLTVHPGLRNPEKLAKFLAASYAGALPAYYAAIHSILFLPKRGKKMTHALLEDFLTRPYHEVFEKILDLIFTPRDRGGYLEDIRERLLDQKVKKKVDHPVVPYIVDILLPEAESEYRTKLAYYGKENEPYNYFLNALYRKRHNAKDYEEIVLHLLRMALLEELYDRGLISEEEITRLGELFYGVLTSKVTPERKEEVMREIDSVIQKHWNKIKDAFPMLTLEEEEFEAPTWSERSPTILNKIQLLADLLARHHSHRGYVDAGVYKALHRILTTPMTTTTFKPWIDQLLDRWEKGEKTHPLRPLLEALGYENDKINSILTKIERGEELTEKDKEILDNELKNLEKYIEENPEISQRVLEELSDVPNPGQAEKVIKQIIRDFRKAHTHRVSYVDTLRDLAQLHEILSHLPEKDTQPPDPHETIEGYLTKLEDHLGKEFTAHYREAANKYLEEDIYDLEEELPHRFLSTVDKKLQEYNRQLDLKILEWTNEGIPREEAYRRARNILNFYKTLLLTTPLMTKSYKEAKRYYEKVAEKHLKEDGEKPLIGPVVSDLVSIHRRIVKGANPLEYRTMLNSFHSTGVSARDALASLLSSPPHTIIEGRPFYHRREHNNLMRRLRTIQTAI